MKRVIRNLCILLTCVLLIPAQCVLSTNAEASTNVMSNKSLQTLVKNAANKCMGWSDTSITNEKELYDFNGNLIAYSVDLSTKGKSGYIIISTSKEDEPVYQFSIDSLSPYDSISNSHDRCIYTGVGGYYAKSLSSSNYYNILSKEELNSNLVSDYQNNSKRKTYKSQNVTKSQAVKNSLLTVDSVQPMDDDDPGTLKLLDVPSYTWYHGCSPTSAAMALRYDRSDVTPSDKHVLIDKLVNHMGTDSLGFTKPENIPTGIEQTMEDYGVNTVSYNEGWGYDESPYSYLVDEIDNNRPLLVNVRNDPTFGNHTMCVIGYGHSMQTDWVYVHDTWSTGTTGFDLYGSLASDHMWTLIFCASE